MKNTNEKNENMTQREFASKGGKARAEKLTKKRRVEIAKYAVKCREEKRARDLSCL